MIDSYMNWRMYTNEDNLEGTDRLYNKYLDIFVDNPRTHIKQDRALFTDYEIIVKTNHPEFAIKESNVRRRYSEFVWLKNKLGMNDVMMVTAPSLPGKRYIGRFKEPFLKSRQLGLQGFMNKVVEVNPFLSDPALHLFLQTELPISQMNSYLECGMHLSNIRDRILISVQKNKELKRRSDDHRQKECESTLLKEHFIRRSRSLASITSNERIEWEKARLDEGGRGWSRYIGDANNWDTNGTEACDYTDYQKESDQQATSMACTACVLPGGRLRLASEYKEATKPVESLTLHKRSLSWHGHNNDAIDLLLDSYDMIEKPNHEYEVTSCSETNSYLQDNRTPDDLSVDINDSNVFYDLAEYNVISLPDDYVDRKQSLHGESFKQTHNKSNSSDMLSRWDENAISPKWNDISESLTNNGFHHSDSYSASSNESYNLYHKP